MRQRQVRLVHDQIVIGENIDVDRARAPAALLASLSAKSALDLDRTLKQRVRIKRRCDHDHGIDESRLVDGAPGRGAVIRRARDKPHRPAGAQARNGVIERANGSRSSTALPILPPSASKASAGELWRVFMHLLAARNQRHFRNVSTNDTWHGHLFSSRHEPSQSALGGSFCNSSMRLKNAIDGSSPGTASRAAAKALCSCQRRSRYAVRPSAYRVRTKFCGGVTSPFCAKSSKTAILRLIDLRNIGCSRA